MKKVIAIILTVVAVMGLVSCGEVSSAEDKVSIGGESEQAGVACGDTVKMSPSDWCAHKIIIEWRYNKDDIFWTVQEIHSVDQAANERIYIITIIKETANELIFDYYVGTTRLDKNVEDFSSITEDQITYMDFAPFKSEVIEK